MKSQAEIYRALLDGKTLHITTGTTDRYIRLNAQGNQEDAITGGSFNYAFSEPHIWTLAEDCDAPVKFPMLCQVSNCVGRWDAYDIITERDESSRKFHSMRGVDWSFARPISESLWESLANHKL